MKLELRGLNRRIVQYLINGHSPSNIISAFVWASTADEQYWIDAYSLDRLTDKHIKKLQKILDDNPED